MRSTSLRTCWIRTSLSADGPNQKWAGDISYIWTGEGWLYLAVILDLYSRRVIGWAVGNRMKRDLAIRALDMAVALRQPCGTAGRLDARSTNPAPPAAISVACIRFMAADSVMSDSSPPRAAEKINGLACCRGRACKSVTATTDSGMRCSRSIFMRTAGMIHSAESMSTSSQRAPRIS